MLSLLSLRANRLTRLSGLLPLGTKLATCGSWGLPLSTMPLISAAKVCKCLATLLLSAASAKGSGRGHIKPAAGSDGHTEQRLTDENSPVTHARRKHTKGAPELSPQCEEDCPHASSALIHAAGNLASFL
jgi:hypothetical protein